MGIRAFKFWTGQEADRRGTVEAGDRLIPTRVLLGGENIHIREG